MSFTMDLYQPLYATRPVVRPELFAGLRAAASTTPGCRRRTRSLRARGLTRAGDRRQGRARLDRLPGAGQGGRRIGYDANGRPLAAQLSEVVVTGKDEERDLDAMASVQALGTSGAMGELFQYTVGNVTLARQKSAMLPIVTDSVQVERLSIYNAGVLGSNPLNGVPHQEHDRQASAPGAGHRARRRRLRRRRAHRQRSAGPGPPAQLRHRPRDARRRRSGCRATPR